LPAPSKGEVRRGAAPSEESNATPPPQGVTLIAIAIEPPASPRHRRGGFEEGAAPSEESKTCDAVLRRGRGVAEAGDRVRISGVIYTRATRPIARLFPDREGQALPIDVTGQIIYYTGPSPAGRARDRLRRADDRQPMDTFTPSLLKLGLKARSAGTASAVKDALKQYRRSTRRDRAGAVLSEFVRRRRWCLRGLGTERSAGSRWKPSGHRALRLPGGESYQDGQKSTPREDPYPQGGTMSARGDGGTAADRGAHLRGRVVACR